ncbi:putative Cytochrome P450 [Seiridium unicorne]|uniref:Cytochrome P450 n=1 Tax=Seiridium unicorne TaxID=138068 RepID=A0ABR2VEG0_9PEZI
MSSSPLAQFAPSSISLEHLKPFGFLFVSVLLASYLLYQWALPKPIPGIPYNVESSRKIMGDVPALLQEVNKPGKTFMSYIRKQVDKHNSPILQIFVRPLGKPMVVLSDFRESQDILMRRKDFDRSRFMRDLFHGVAPEHHIMQQTNSVWKAHRRLLQDLMSPSFLHHVAGPAIWSNVQRLIKLWDLKAEIASDRSFSATDDIYGAALDAVFAFAFGEGFQYSATAPNVRVLEELSQSERVRLRDDGRGNNDQPIEFPEAPRDTATASTLDIASALEEINGKPYAQLIWRFITARKPRFSRALKLRDEYIYHELKEAVRRMENQDMDVRSAVDHMMQRETKLAEKDGRNPEYLSPAMADETFGFVIAGHETTSTTILWGLKLLADNPQPQAHLRKVLQAAHHEALKAKRSPTIDEITEAHIPYLDAVMEEILRCGGTVPGVDREAQCDTEVLGYPIAKGTVVLMSGMGPSMLEPGIDIDESRRSETSQTAKSEGRFRAWDVDEIGKFKPERWLIPAADGSGNDGESQFDSAAGPQLAFGLGTRGCYGKRLAYLELRILITMILWNFELLRTPEKLSGYDAIAGVTYKPQHCYVRLRKVLL